jgi:hypothetical protein
MALNVANTDSTLGVAAANLLVCPNASQITILKATVCNTDAVAHKVTVYRISSGGAAAVSNALIDGLAVGAGATVTLPISGQTLINGQAFQGLADTAAVVNINLSYAQSP